MVTYLGSLVQLCCGEGGTLQRNITGMCGECPQCLSHTGFAPTHGMCAFLVYTAQAPGCSAGELSKESPALHALPRSKPLRFRSRVLHKGIDFVGSAFCALHRSEKLKHPDACQAHSPQAEWYVLSPPWSQLLGFLDVQRECHLRCAVCLLWRADLWLDPIPPGGCQPSRIPGRLGQ